MDLTGIDRIDLRVASGGLGGSVEVHADEPSGPLLGKADVAGTGGDNTWTTVQVPVTDPGGAHDLVLVFRNPLLPPNPVAPQSMFRVNYLTFVGTGLDSPPTVEATGTPTSGAAPLVVDFHGNATDPEGGELAYHWDFGVAGATADTASARYTYTAPGTYTAVLTVTDAAGNSESNRVQVTLAAPLDTTPPTITDLQPGNGASTNQRRPAIGATVTDAGAGLDTAGITVYLDGRSVAFSYDDATGRVTHVPPKRLAIGTHEVRVLAEDRAGNVASRRWSFTVTR